MIAAALVGGLSCSPGWRSADARFAARLSCRASRAERRSRTGQATGPASTTSLAADTGSLRRSGRRCWIPDRRWIDGGLGVRSL